MGREFEPLQRSGDAAPVNTLKPRRVNSLVLKFKNIWSFTVFGHLRRQVEGVLEGFAGFRANPTENREAQAALRVRLPASEPRNFSYIILSCSPRTPHRKVRETG